MQIVGYCRSLFGLPPGGFQLGRLTLERPLGVLVRRDLENR